MKIPRGIFAGLFAALLFAAVLVGSCGVLLESALRAHAPVERYGAAAAVVTGPQRVETRVKQLGSPPAKQSRPVAEPARVPVAMVERLRAVPGVRAVVADVSFPVLTGAGATVSGHGWDSAALRPYKLSAGRAPQAPDEVVLSAATGAKVGGTVPLQITGKPQPYRVTGLVGAGPAAAFFAPGTAATLSGHPAHADALAVLTDRGVSPRVLQEAVRGTPGLHVATGAARGDAEDPAVAAARPDMIELSAVLGGVAIMTALIVIGGLGALSVRERARELALLRAVGATPGQVRGQMVRQALGAAVPAGVLGGVSSLAAGAGLHAAMISKGVLPEGFGLSLSPLPALAALGITVLAAALTTLLASLRTARIRPAQALGEAALEPSDLPRWRRVTGLVFLVLGLNSLGVSMATAGQAAAASVSGLVLTLVIATALLGPSLARIGDRVLGPPVARLAPVAGKLARHASTTAALRAGSVITPVALAVAFAGVQLFAQTTMVRAAEVQAADGTRADQALVSDGPGLPPGAAEAVRRTPGVRAATPVKHTSAIMAVREMGEQALRSLSARGVTPDAARTMDPGAVSGRLDALTGTAVALSRDVAGGVRVGSAVTLWLGDGTQIKARVVAIYERGMGFGDLLLPHDLAVAHSASTLDDQILVAGTADLRQITAAYAGARVLPAEALAARQSEALRLQGFLSLVVVAAIAGFIVIGLVTTLALATGARRREFALLRQVGATRRQVVRMVRLEAVIVLGTGLVAGALIAGVTLLAFATAVTGLPLPAVPLRPAAALLLVVGGSGAAAMSLPARALLRRRAPGTL
ncbi:FtsX-like permease family protein [Actinomadura hibisca]|uniref:FtsX-like permease family protein n=1 Tax=Actinomadura hibisca TaxID=68565 RepID=UPI000A06C3B1|nr:FtsX family ABC transporter permease [Actinomadura hibisca]